MVFSQEPKKKPPGEHLRCAQTSDPRHVSRRHAWCGSPTLHLGRFPWVIHIVTLWTFHGNQKKRMSKLHEKSRPAPPCNTKAPCETSPPPKKKNIAATWPTSTTATRPKSSEGLRPPAERSSSCSCCSEANGCLEAPSEAVHMGCERA